MASLATALVLATYVTPGLSAMAFGALVGAAGGSMRAIEVASFPHYFGTRHIGSIRGLVASLSVASTAFGPLLFALGRDLTGSYTALLLASVPLPVAVGVAAFVTHPPARAGP